MRRLWWMKLFQWYGMMCYWIYIVPALAKTMFKTTVSAHPKAAALLAVGDRLLADCDRHDQGRGDRGIATFHHIGLPRNPQARTLEQALLNSNLGAILGPCPTASSS